MGLRICPVATVEAPAGKVWSLLDRPAAYGEWWDAKTDSIVPPGPARIGQQIDAHARALGRRWPIRIQVVGVNPIERELDLATSLPLGITILNHIVVTPVEAGRSRLSFG